MKKIAIITFHRAINYGAVLQAYALQNCLKGLGYDAFEIDYVPSQEIQKYKLISLKRIKNPKRFFMDIISFPENLKKHNKFRKFLDSNISLTSSRYDLSDLKNNPPLADVFITGSDQVWNYELLNGIDDAFFLNFESEKFSKKISYAASIGKEFFLESDYGVLKKYLLDFYGISVREKTAIKALKKLGIDNAVTVCDPVFLIEKYSWNKLCKKQYNKQKYILSYMLSKSDEYCKMVSLLAKETNLKVVCFEKKPHYDCEFEKKSSAGPDEFVNLIRDAEYVITTSFHATAFSIIFEKKFFVYPYSKTSSRVTDLLEKLGISNRAVNSLEEFKKLDFDEDIDYENVNKILEKEREKSINWLIDAIEK